MSEETNKFGKPIDLGDDSNLEQGNGMIKKFLDIRSDYKTILKAFTSINGEPDAKRFFCKEDCIYVFPREAVTALWNALNRESNHDNDSIVLFHGCRQEEKPEEKLKEKPNGRPTLIALVYKYNKETKNLERIKIDEKDGREHPGGTSRTFAFTPVKDKPGSFEASPEIPWPELSSIF